MLNELLVQILFKFTKINFNFSFEVKLVTLVHHMGGVIRKECNSKVTHLVANCTQGEKFRVCKLTIFVFSV